MPMLTSSWNNFGLAGALQSSKVIALLHPKEKKIMQAAQIMKFCLDKTTVQGHKRQGLDGFIDCGCSRVPD